MPDNPVNPTWIEPPPKRTGGLGCFAKGCLALVVAALVVLVVLVLGGYFTIRHISHTYLAPEPLKLPVVQAPPAEVQQLQQEWHQFEQTAKQNQNVPPPERQPARLAYTADQINELISANPKASGHVSVGIANGAMQIQFSIPSDALHRGGISIPGSAGRYLNGSVTVQTTGPTPPSQLVIANAILNGQTVPNSVVDTGYRGYSLRSYAADYAARNGISTVQIVGDKLVVNGGQ